MMAARPRLRDPPAPSVAVGARHDVKHFSAFGPSRRHCPSCQQLLTRMGEPAMTKTLITTALALGLGFLSTSPSFAAGSYFVNGRAASPAEAQHLVASGVQPGAWVVNGYGI